MLAQAQSELEAHFTALAALRRPHGYPVYALEHGLSAEQIDALAALASATLYPHGPNDRHWLIWTVLGAEAGYAYTGDEYWPTLERAPGEWRDNHRRRWLRLQYERFRDQFGGPQPVGRWADQFSQIAWPIANAILPRYLQAHFAAQLHAKRWALASLAVSDSANLGNLLREDYDGSSSRFADFLQQTDLTSQIVRALREGDLGTDMPRILPDLLARIVGDLEGRRDSRELLRAARSVISRHQSTLAPALRGAVPNRTPSAGGEAPIAAVTLAARLASDGTVLLGAIFPDIGAALARCDREPRALTAVRIRVVGAETRPEPALALLGLARRDRAIATFPAAGEPVVRIETDDAPLRAMLQPLFLLEPAPIWLLRRHNDGMFREVRGRQARPDEVYLVLFRQAPNADLRDQAGLIPQIASAQAIHAFLLETPQRWASQQQTALRALGIGTAAGIRIDPLGISPSAAPDTGLPQWGASETILLRLTADFALQSFAVRLDGGPAETLVAEEGEVRLEIGALAIGRHSLTVRAVMRTPDGEAETGDAASFNFAIVAPQPWPNAMRGRAGFRLLLEPAGADLEALFAERVAVRVFGPAGRAVNWLLETFDAAGHPTGAYSGGNSPVGAPVPIAILDRMRTNLSDAIDAAHRVDLVGAIGELGRQSLAFPHRVEPLRWHFDAGTRRARLIDETAHEDPVTARTYSLSRPLAKARLDYSQAIDGLTVEAPGALLVADYQGRQYSIFASAPPTQTLHALSELGVAQDFTLGADDGEAVLILLSALARWSRSRPVGPQAVNRKSQTLARIVDQLPARACGRDFAALLATGSAGALVRAQALVGGSPGFGSRARTFAPIDDEDGLDAFQTIARTYRIDLDGHQAVDAYRLAVAPGTLRLGGAVGARTRIAALLDNRTLVRGAFLASAAMQAARAEQLAAAI